MMSRNKPAMTAAERKHVDRVKSLSCGVCGAGGTSEAHELEQGLWFLSMPLCADCHRGGFNGIHGQARVWKALKLTEQTVLNETLRRLM